MINSDKKQKLFKAVDKICAVLTSITTASFLSALIFLYLSDYLGYTRVIATLKNAFPTRELESIVLILVCIFILGGITMWSFSDNKLWFLCPANAFATLCTTLFFILFTKLYIFIALLVVCIVYLTFSIIRSVLIFKKYDSDTEETEET